MINSYKDLTLEKYIELGQLGKDIDGKEEIDIQTEMIAVLADADVDTILDLPLNEYRKLANALAFLSNKPVSSDKPVKKITINGNEYWVIQEAKEMTAGQYIDYNTHLQRNDMYTNLPLILSTLIIPKGHKYNDGYDMETVLNDINKMSIETALSISGFFLRKSQRLTRAMLTSLAWKMRMAMWKTRNKEEKKMMREAIKGMDFVRNMLKDGDGYRALILSRRR